MNPYLQSMGSLLLIAALLTGCAPNAEPPPSTLSQGSVGSSASVSEAAGPGEEEAPPSRPEPMVYAHNYPAYVLPFVSPGETAEGYRYRFTEAIGGYFGYRPYVADPEGGIYYSEGDVIRYLNQGAPVDFVADATQVCGGSSLWVYYLRLHQDYAVWGQRVIYTLLRASRADPTRQETVMEGVNSAYYDYGTGYLFYTTADTPMELRRFHPETGEDTLLYTESPFTLFFEDYAFGSIFNWRGDQLYCELWYPAYSEFHASRVLLIRGDEVEMIEYGTEAFSEWSLDPDYDPQGRRILSRYNGDSWDYTLDFRDGRQQTLPISGGTVLLWGQQVIFQSERQLYAYDLGTGQTAHVPLADDLVVDGCWLVGDRLYAMIVKPQAGQSWVEVELVQLDAELSLIQSCFSTQATEGYWWWGSGHAIEDYLFFDINGGNRYIINARTQELIDPA